MMEYNVIIVAQYVGASRPLFKVGRYVSDLSSVPLQSIGGALQFMFDSPKLEVHIDIVSLPCATTCVKK